MKTVQIENLIKKLGTVACLALVTSCGDMKNVLEAPKVSIDPPLAAVDPVAPEAAEAPPAAPTDPLFDQQWALSEKKLDVAKAWQAVGSGTKRLTVAIVSSGVDYNHEDLQGNLYINARENTGASELKAKATDKKDSDNNGYVDDLAGWDTVEGDGFPFDNTGDGTAAAGILGARHNNGLGIKGILSDVTIVPVRYIDAAGAASTERLIGALRYVNSLTPKVDLVLVQVANVKLESAEEGEGGAALLGAALGAELAQLEKRDVPVVVSAGNRKDDVSKSAGVISIFTAKKNVFAITSVDENDVKPAAANYSPTSVLTAAPGVNVLSTAPGSKYAPSKGTLIAAAHVTGAIGLVLSKYYGQISTDDLRKALVDDKKSDVVPSLTNETLGSNRLNIGKLVSQLVAEKK